MRLFDQARRECQEPKTRIRTVEAIGDSFCSQPTVSAGRCFSNGKNGRHSKFNAVVTALVDQPNARAVATIKLDIVEPIRRGGTAMAAAKRRSSIPIAIDKLRVEAA